MLPYTPVPTLLPATISQPQDAIDNVVVATVNPMVQKALDAIAWQQLLRTEFASFNLLDQTIAASGYFGFNTTPGIGGTGFSVSGAGDTEIHVADPGVYLAALVGVCTNSSGTADQGQPFFFSLDAGALGTYGKVPGVRPGADSGVTTKLGAFSGFGIVEITNVATQFFQLFNPNVMSLTIAAADGMLSQLYLVRLK